MRQSYWIKPNGDIIHAPKGHQAYIEEHGQEHGLPVGISLSDLISQGWVRVSSENVIIRQVESPEVLNNMKDLLMSLGYDKYTFWVNSKPHTISLDRIESAPIVEIYKDMLAGKLEPVADAYDQGIFETQPSWGESESAGSTGMKDRGTEFMPQDKTKEVWWERDLLDYQKKNFPGKKDVIPPEPDNGVPTQASDIVDRMQKKADYSETCECGGPAYPSWYEPTGELVLKCEDCSQEFESDEEQWKNPEHDIELIRRHNSSDNEISKKERSNAISELMGHMGITFGLARQFVQEYNFHTITNSEAVKILNREIGVMDEREKEMKDLETEWSREGNMNNRWYKWGGIQVQAEVYGRRIGQLQIWTDEGKPVPKSYTGQNARYELDRDYVLHLYHYSTEIVTADMKNKVILKVTTGGHYSVSTKARIMQILYAFRGMGYPSVRLVRYEYDASQTEADRDAEEARLNEQDRKYRNQNARERYHRNVVQRRETKEIMEKYPKEYEELKSGDYGYHSVITLKDIQNHIANKENEQVAQEKYPEEFAVLKKSNPRAYVTLYAIEKYMEKLKEKQELINKYPREFKELTDEGNTDISTEDLEERVKFNEMKDLESEWSREGKTRQILRKAWDNPDPSAEDAQTSPMEETNSNRMVDPDGTLYRKQKGRGAPMGVPSEDGELKCNLPAGLLGTASDVIERYLINREKQHASEPQIREELENKGIPEEEIDHTYKTREKNLFKETV